MRTILAAFFFLIGLSPAQAGSLFPPDNMSATPNQMCPRGEVLRWMGDRVDCVNPTDGVFVRCPSGHVLTGIVYGRAECTPISAVSCNSTSSSAAAATSTSTSTSTSGSGSSSASSSASASASSSSRSGSSSSRR